MPEEFEGFEGMDAQEKQKVETSNLESQEVTSDSNVDETPRTPTEPDKISVHVVDTSTPIILLFGAPSSGKTMTLVRLAKYLRKHGYSLQVDTNFCTTAWEYNVNASNFNSMLNTTKALSGTGYNDFLFIKVSDEKGRPICQILEGAGEDYFKTMVPPGVDRTSLSFPPYMAGIFTGNNKKVWMFLTEPNWKTSYEMKAEYVQRIRYCKNQYIANKDKSIILYNKVDTTNFVSGPGKVNVSQAMKACNDEYSGLFEIFKNPSALPFTDKYTCKFVPFSTGAYGQVIPGRPQTYDASHDKYPHDLWETIMKCIKG